MMRIPCFPMVVLLSGLLACGGGTSTPPATAGAVSGNWQFILQKTPTAQPRIQSGFLLQSGRSVSGSLLLNGSCATVGPVMGTITGGSISLVVSNTGQTVQLDGTVASGATAMSGTYTILAQGCGSSENGTWSATLIRPLNGSFHGTFTSSHQGGSVFSASGSIAQEINTGANVATLTGTITSTGSPCLSTANISGAISGTNVVLTFIAGNGTQIGQVIAQSTPDASSLTGNYLFGSQRAGACFSGDAGRVSINLP